MNARQQTVLFAVGKLLINANLFIGKNQFHLFKPKFIENSLQLHQLVM